MARHSLTDARVRALVDRLASRFLADGSVNALQRTLTENLAPDRSEGWIYPNRLHALLSEDPARGVNTDTIETLEKALGRLDERFPAGQAAAPGADIRARVLRDWEARVPREPGSEDVVRFLDGLASSLGIPQAVVRKVLGDAHVLPALAARLSPPTRPGGKTESDWSFQDEAYRACVQALRRGPKRKIGLIIPTGGGKTRIAVRVALRILADSERTDSVVVWITHRQWLLMHARRELQRAINSGTPDLPDDSVELLAGRVEITMLSDLRSRIEMLGDRLALVVVDEAHHAAAPSYEPIFLVGSARGLFLTATPNRTDALPIGIDEIPYTVTYRELFERGVLVEPCFEPPLTIEGLDWDNAAHLRDLADYVLERADGDFVKTLVVASRTEYVERLHAVMTEELARRPGHVLGEDDLGFVHAGGSSTGSRPAEFLDEFVALPRGILVATAQMLGEGFDDPALNAVVVTYPSSSMIQLMQAAGRCLRSAPGKERAYVVQVRDSDLAYHYEQRWLYQDISDVLRPQLLDRRYSGRYDVSEQVDQLLQGRNVAAPVAARIRAQLDELQEGETFSILFTGLPYEGLPEEFASRAPWSAVAVPAKERAIFVQVFNDFSARGPDVKEPQELLRKYLEVTPGPGTTWTSYVDMLWAMDYARRELGGEAYVGRESRGYAASKGTTWLTYVTFTYAPRVPAALEVFLGDAVNRDDVLGDYGREPDRWVAAVKIELPLAGTLAFLLDVEQRQWLQKERDALGAILRMTPAVEGFAALARWRLGQGPTPLPQVLIERFETFLREASLERYSCTLKSA